MKLSDFFSGNCFDSYEYFGAHPAKEKDKNGWVFRAFAPRAASVDLIGEFNGWQADEMERDENGIFSLFVSNAVIGMMYKYRIHQQDGKVVYKCDPYGFQMEVPPQNASILADLNSYQYSDQKWLKDRNRNFNSPMNIYELHFGSWKRKEDGSWYSYTELLDELIPYLKENGYTHIELLPLNEHPFYGSWGYLASGFFSITSRYGTPEQFMKFVNTCHQNGIGVIMDFVLVHFVTDDFSLLRFDGMPLYEYENTDIAYNEWGSCNFNFYRNEVCSFLMSAANLWLDKYHIDGLRMDAISNVIYWQGNSKRGVNTGGIKFLKKLNAGLHKLHKNIMLIAEDSSNYIKVTAPVEYDGLGFDYKWDMGWMHDTLDYFKMPPAERVKQYHKLSFSMQYFYHEKYLLPLSHDEVVHGKAAILQKMWGDYEDKFKQAKTLYTYMLTHPGKKLNFMGNELGHFSEWNENKGLDWNLLTYPKHDSYYHYIRALNELYIKNPALYHDDYNNQCFRWLEVHAEEKLIYVYERSYLDNHIIVALNLSDQLVEDFIVGIDKPVRLRELLSSDEEIYGGNTKTNKSPIIAKEMPYKGWSHQFTIQLPPFAGIVYEIVRTPLEKSVS